jgi:hypothetical protein
MRADVSRQLSALSLAFDTAAAALELSDRSGGFTFDLGLMADG